MRSTKLIHRLAFLVFSFVLLACSGVRPTPTPFPTGDVVTPSGTWDQKADYALLILGDRDVLLGEIGGTPVYIGPLQFDAWRHTQLIIDVVPGRGGMFSLDNGRERRFLTRSRMFSAAELATLDA